ncbi:MAG: glycosyltransferase family 39 protein [Candidatus Binatia bacterium]
MNRSRLAIVGAALIVLGVAVRMYNAWAAPVLAGYDSFSHFVYVWYLSETGRVPLPLQGWSFFHPPLYYALMAGFWEGLSAWDPEIRLRAGKVLVAALGCVHAAVAWNLIGRRFPGHRRAQAMGSGFLLLVPVQVYSAGFLGNEGLNAVLGSLSILALLRALDRPTVSRAAVLGLCLGLAMLTKYSAVAVVAAALATIAMRAVVTGRRAEGARLALVAAAVLLLVAGPHYARNVAAFGNPFQLTRDAFMTSYVEANQPQAARGWADYLTFDPLIFRRPVWPRGSTPLEDAAPYGFGRSVRESVWTGLYANTWFDGFGGWVVPPVVESEVARRSGQVLLTLGLLPTLLMLLGACTALAAVRRKGWDDATMASAMATAAILVLFVHGTRAVPIAAAVKATYLTPVAVVFAYWLAHGLVWLEAKQPRWSAPVDGLCLLLGAISLVVFCQGLLFDPADLRRSMPRFVDGETTQYGIVQYAGGRREAARRAFQDAAASDYHLAWENLGFLAIDEGREREGLRLLRRAARLQRSQLDGGEIHGEKFLRLALAEYDHSMAVVLHGMGNRQRALARWHRAIMGDPLHAEALWCLALVKLENGLATTRGEEARREVLGDADRALTNIRAIDPGLAEGWMLAAAVRAAAGDCEGARRLLREREALPWWTQRRFPAETGTGAGFSASIGRRRLVAPVRPEIDPPRALAACDVAVAR